MRKLRGGPTRVRFAPNSGRLVAWMKTHHPNAAMVARSREAKSEIAYGSLKISGEHAPLRAAGRRLTVGALIASARGEREPIGFPCFSTSIRHWTEVERAEVVLKAQASSRF
jgi:hypothetical protein